VYSTGRANLVDADRVLLLLPDGFGLARHNLILADRFAEHGWPTILPDYFEGTLRNTLSCVRQYKSLRRGL
jgi:dienelactone hydrolase